MRKRLSYIGIIVGLIFILVGLLGPQPCNFIGPCDPNRNTGFMSIFLIGVIILIVSVFSMLTKPKPKAKVPKP